ncbi:ABC transporter permease [Halosimplex halophilum]|uniref:ABC transporter permease n=1 Tax=Halosimplex halophilum TaxID=2559572 RepID=UPI00107FC311|nr:ABC transporter permease [Halosimplex halophilum]
MNRWKYLLKRVGLSLPVLFFGTSLTFLIIRVGPINPAAAIIGVTGNPQSSERYRLIREDLGLDQPLWEQYVDFMIDMFTLNLGQSWVLQAGTPTTELIAIYAPRTIWLGLWSVLIAILVGVPLGFYAGLNVNTYRDYLASFSGIVWRAMPNFWLAIILVGLLSSSEQLVGISWERLLVETSVVGPPGIADANSLGDFGVAFKKVLPAALVLGSASMGNEMRIGRTAVLESINAKYVETAKMRGVPDRVIVWKHVFRNALIPLVPIITSEAFLLVGGSVLVELIFGINGLGYLFYRATVQGDIPLAASLMFVFIVVLVAVNITQDIMYTLIDPRVGYERQ